MSRRKQRRTNVSAAIAGAKEVADELSGNTTAANREGRKEYSTRNSSSSKSSRKPRNSGGSKGTLGNISEALLSGQASAVPRPVLYTMASGREVSTELYTDRGFIQRAQTYTYTANYMMWEGAPKAHWFQSGAASNQAIVDNTIGGFMVNLYSYIIRELANHTGKTFAIRDTSLANTGTFNSLPAWLNNYSAAYMILRTMQSILQAADYNFVLSTMASAVNQNLPRLLADLDRLFMFSVPPGLITILDRMCGVKSWDKSQPAIITGLVSNVLGADPLDLTLSASIQTYLTQAETCLTALITGTGGFYPSVANDAQLVSNIFAIAYGDTNFPMNKGVSYDQVEVMMALSQAVTYDDQTSHLLYTWPNSNCATPGVSDIPFLIPKGGDAAAIRQYLSILRSPVYSANPLAGSTDVGGVQPHQVGLYQNVSLHGGTNNSEVLVHTQLGGTALVFNQATGPTLLSAMSYNPAAYLWSPEADDELTSYAIDERNFPDLDTVWVDSNWMSQETLFLLEEVFLEPIRRNGGAML